MSIFNSHYSGERPVPTTILLATLLAVAALILPASLLAQSLVPPSKLDVSVSTSSFAYDTATSLVEIAYLFPEQGLTYRTDRERGGAVTGILYLRLKLCPVLPGGDTLFSDWMNVLPRPDNSRPRLQSGQRSLAIPPGDYNALLYYKDVNDPLRHDSLLFDLSIPDFTAGRLMLSDLQLALRADPDQADSNNPFYKSGHVVVPNVTGLFAWPIKELVAYIETYNANRIRSPRLLRVWQIAASNPQTGKYVIFYQRNDTLERPTSAAERTFEHFAIDSLSSGDYYLVVRVYDGLTAGADSSVCAHKFHVVNPPMDSIMFLRRGALPASLDSNSRLQDLATSIDPFFAGATEADLDREWSRAFWTASDQERDVFEQLDGAMPKAAFLTQFWKVRDDSPDTPDNEFRDDYYDRSEEAHRMYRTRSAGNGWESDRGRVLLVYGRPDGVESHPQDFNKRPYEIWSYTSLGFQFVFLDNQESGAYRLVHSTAPSEIHRENWERDALINKNWVNE